MSKAGSVLALLDLCFDGGRRPLSSLTSRTVVPGKQGRSMVPHVAS